MQRPNILRRLPKPKPTTSTAGSVDPSQRNIQLGCVGAFVPEHDPDDPVAPLRTEKSRCCNKSQRCPLQCPECSMEFPYQSYLDMHMRTHTGERPFECDVCSKRFTQSAHLYVHKKSHSDERPYACPQCPKTFKLSYRLKEHIVTHGSYEERKYACELCPCAFHRKQYLKNHVARCHKSEGILPCHICGRQCGSRETLQIHLRTHLGARPFKCSLCPKTFPRKDKFKLHLATKHPQLLSCSVPS